MSAPTVAPIDTRGASPFAFLPPLSLTPCAGRRPSATPCVAEQGRERQLVGPLDERVEERREVAAREALGDAAQPVLGDADAGRAVLAPQLAHQRVERAAVLAQRQVERERDERALRVVADARVGRVLVGPVVLDPRVEARVGDALHGAPGRAQDARHRAAEELEVAVDVDDAAAHQRQVVVVRRDALERPQLPRVRLAREVVGHERRRLDALHVPAVEVLVAREPEEAAVVVGDLAMPGRAGRGASTGGSCSSGARGRRSLRPRP
jgi:hypothetical protein